MEKATGEELVARVGQLLQRLFVLEARLKEIEAENVALRTAKQAPRARPGTNSRNSGQPPSSDGPDVKPHPNLRFWYNMPIIYTESS